MHHVAAVLRLEDLPVDESFEVFRSHRSRLAQDRLVIRAQQELIVLIGAIVEPDLEVLHAAELDFKHVGHLV